LAISLSAELINGFDVCGTLVNPPIEEVHTQRESHVFQVPSSVRTSCQC
jgi:hypothetical protein